MDPETKACMDRILEQAQKHPQGNTIPFPKPQFIRPSEEEIKKRVERMVARTIDGKIPYRLKDAAIEELEVVPKKESIFITGPAGTGKSYMAAALMKDSIKTRAEEWLEANMENDYLEREANGLHRGESFRYSPWRWITVPELLLSLRASFREGSKFTEEEIIDEYSDVSLLILDDLGAEKSSEFSIQSLYLIIDRRYSSMLSTIITSNLSLGEISEKVGDRIASRIAGMCKIIELKGKDRRIS